MKDDGGLAVVRIKPLGVGNDGVEASAKGDPAISVASKGVSVSGSSARSKTYKYPKHVIGAEHDQ